MNRLYILSFFIFILFITSIIISYNNKNNIENYDNWDWKLYNSNWNKPWTIPPAAFNNPYSEDLPSPSNNVDNFPNYTLSITDENKIKQILAKMVNRTQNTGPFTKEGKIYHDLSWPKYFKLNKQTWFKDINDIASSENDSGIHNISTKISSIDTVNNILNWFIKEFNKNFPTSNFSIVKYRIHQLNEKTNEYAIIAVLTRPENNYNGTVLYLDFVYDASSTSQTIPKLIYYDLIGYYKTEKIFLLDGFSKRFFELNPVYRKSRRDKTLNEFLNDDNWQYLNINFNNVDRILWKQKQYNFDNTLHHQYTCFNAEPWLYNPSMDTNGDRTILNYVYNKTNCEAPYDNFGRRKPRGVWDRPCVVDEECPFYKANRNYANGFGGCNRDTGFCEMPKGMRNLGYRRYFAFDLPREQTDTSIPVDDMKRFGNPAPLCYNCTVGSISDRDVGRISDSGSKIKAMSGLDTCCAAQNSRTLYPALKGPDYAFVNDFQERVNKINIK